MNRQTKLEKTSGCVDCENKSKTIALLLEWHDDQSGLLERQWKKSIVQMSDDELLHWANYQRLKLGLIEPAEEIPEFMR